MIPLVIPDDVKRMLRASHSDNMGICSELPVSQRFLGLLKRHFIYPLEREVRCRRCDRLTLLATVLEGLCPGCRAPRAAAYYDGPDLRAEHEATCAFCQRWADKMRASGCPPDQIRHECKVFGARTPSGSR